MKRLREARSENKVFIWSLVLLFLGICDGQNHSEAKGMCLTGTSSLVSLTTKPWPVTEVLVFFTQNILIGESPHCWILGLLSLILQQSYRQMQSEIISHWGYEREEHEVLTEDGYLLLIFRIPHGRNERKESYNTRKPVVYLQHGFTVSADYWVLNPPSNCPAFLLADAGFDVWLGNSRGTNNGRKHVSLDPDSKEFWDFSFDEQIAYDIPATIDFILNKTGQTQLYYIGHSQGVYVAYGTFATNPQLAKKIKMNFALGPVVMTKYLRGVFRTVAYIDPKVIKALFGEKDIFSRSADNPILQFLCQREKIATACNNLLTVIFGYNPKNVNESRLDVYIGHIPSGTSIRSILHFSQGIRSGSFQRYDWGSESLNMLHYNQSTPPIYKIENMKVRTAMWSGGQDLLGDTIDTENLAAKTPNLVYHKKILEYDHLDFIIGKDLTIKVYKEVIEFINKDQSE